MATTKEKFLTIEHAEGLDEDRKAYGFDTLALHSGTYPDPATGAMLTP